jgi:formylglycine-generating enzyme required for sulfatase activity
MKKNMSRLLLLWLTLQPFFPIITAENSVSAQVKKTAEKPPNPASKSIAEFTSQARYALVIGNGAYPGIPLTNPLNDVALIAKSLRSIGFNVTDKKNLTLAEMRGAIQEFSRKLPADAVGLFFFAGHGLQVSGKNFLLPVDYKEVKTEKDLLETQLDLDSIIATISKKSGLTIIVLDACRNNNGELALSFKSEQGFTAPKQNSGGIYIAYSTSPGTIAYDGTEGNSPYAKALAQNLLLSPGRLEDIFIKTRIDVRNQTIDYSEGEQIPWENGSLSKIFYLTPDKLRKPATFTAQNTAVKSFSIKPKLPFGIKSLLPLSFVVPQLDNRGSRLGLDNKNAAYYPENLGAAKLEMIEIPGGKFQMGSSSEEVERAYEDALKSNDEADREVITAEMPQHWVDLPGFFMSRTEITQGQWRAVMNSLPEIPQESRGDDKPVVNVTWKEAVKFCDALSVKTKRNYRLPSEAEWEYAARAGTETPFAFGANINSNYVNFFALVPFAEGLKGEFRDKPVAAGQLNAPNNFGIHDMHGNVAEWCADYWHPDYNGAPNDGSVWNEPARQKDDDEDDPALYRVIRGGSFQSIGNNCRSAQRRARPITDDDRYSDLGFRVVISN